MMNEKTSEKKSDIPVWGRIALISITFIIVTGTFQLIGMWIAKVPLTDPVAFNKITVYQQFIILLFTAPGLLSIIFIFRKYVDKKSVRSLGFDLKNRGKDIIFGFAVALIVIGGGSLILYLTGYIHFSAIHLDVRSLFFGFLLYILVSLNEEILVRGYILNNLMTSMNKYLALTISAIIFASFHMFNAGISFLAITNIFLAGVLLGSTYIFTKNLWFPLSLHLFWNFFQGPVLGYSVSGNKSVSLFSLYDLGNPTINGGKFGFEGSIVCTIIAIFTTLFIILYYNQRSTRQSIRLISH